MSPRFQLTLSADELSRALKATLPHVANEKVWPELAVVQLSVIGSTLLVSATNRATAACATVQIVDATGITGSREDDVFAIKPPIAKDIVALFKPKGDDSEEQYVRIDVVPHGEDNITMGSSNLADYGLNDGPRSLEIKPTVVTDEVAGQVAVTDISGLFDGKEFTFHSAPISAPLLYLPGLLAGYTADSSAVTPVPGRTSGQMLALFQAASRAYGTLVFQPTRSPDKYMVTAGKEFLGILHTVTVEPDTEAHVKMKQDLTAWQDILHLAA